MDMSKGPAAPTSGNQDDGFNPMDDPEIAALLAFEPVPRKVTVAGGWTADKQREFIAWLAVHGSTGKASEAVGMHRTGAIQLYKSPLGASFRAAWDSAVALAAERSAEAAAMAFLPPGTRPPSIDQRFKPHAADGQRDWEGNLPLPGKVLNETGLWEDADSFRRRGEEARDHIAEKLVRIRRLYLQEISSCPGKRAAFEILTELPIDWDVAARGEPQADEPLRCKNQREPDMVLMAESGWTFGEHGYGPDRKRQAREAIDEHRAQQGLEPVDWEADEA